jgi:Spy/CpxP family protein refolding chaperone
MRSKQFVKLAFAISVLTLMCVLTASAQRMQRMRMTPEERAKVMADSLSLDSTQTAQVTVILKDQQDAMQKIREDNQGDFDAMRGAMTELRKKTDDKIMTILTDVQKTKYQDMMKNRPMGRMGGPRGGGGN